MPQGGLNAKNHPQANSPFFHGLSERDLSEIGACLREKPYAKGEILFNQGAACERIFMVAAGRVKVYRLSSSGREQILEMLGPGDTCACNPGSPAWSCLSTAEAVTDCTVWILLRHDYVRMIRDHPALAHALNRLFAEKLRCFGSLIEEVSLKDVRKRLVKFLLDLQAEQQAGGEILNIHFTRAEIAHRIGAARETVARHLHALKRRRLIDIKPSQIVIRDKQGLENLL